MVEEEVVIVGVSLPSSAADSGEAVSGASRPGRAPVATRQLDAVFIGDSPTPQQKRRRGQRAAAPDDLELVMFESLSGRSDRGNVTDRVPCEVCLALVPFEDYAAHVASHASAQGASIVADKRRRTDRQEFVPCDLCGERISFSDFAAHAEFHRQSSAAKPASANARPCEHCGALIEPEDLNDHLAAHRVHAQLVDSELEKSTADADVALHVVEMARKGGTGLPGNRKSIAQGDPVLVRYSDGHWYAAHIQAVRGDGGFLVSWDPPWHTWAAEDVAAGAALPRNNQPREVCNFDVAEVFVRKLKSMLRSGAQGIEVVYHYTREENVQKIVENNLKVPGQVNSDGTAVGVANGEVYGRGIYAATNLDFSKSFGHGLKCGFLCLALPGARCKGQKLSAKSDSLEHGELRIFRSSEQLLPLFFTDKPTAAMLEKVARDIAAHLLARLVSPVIAKPATLTKGTQVEACWGKTWWPAVVVAAHPNGTYDVSWSGAYTHWPPCRHLLRTQIRRRLPQMSKT